LFRQQRATHNLVFSSVFDIIQNLRGDLKYSLAKTGLFSLKEHSQISEFRRVESRTLLCGAAILVHNLKTSKRFFLFSGFFLIFD
ncbi:MAG: hypothetical protein P1V20_28895, partial [Verrucomicrobiales bacterium]|nr:hypothetical protein [Verrucomicrobiales bacterium]